MFDQLINDYIFNINVGKNKKTDIELPSITELNGYERKKQYQREYRRLYKQKQILTEEQYNIKLQKHREYMKTYVDKNSEKRREYVMCDICNRSYQVYNKSHHMNTKKHKKISEFNSENKIV